MSTRPGRRRTKKAKLGVTQPGAGFIDLTLLSLLVVGIVSLANVASQLALRPLYGGTAASKHFQSMSLVICLATSVLPTKTSKRTTWACMSVILAASPVLLHVVGTRTASWNSPVWGPIATQLVSSIPTQILGVGMLVPWIIGLSTFMQKNLFMRPLAGLLCWLAIERGDQIWWDVVPFSPNLTSCSLFVVLVLGASLPAAILSVIESGILVNQRERQRSPENLGLVNLTAGLYLAIPLMISIAAQTSTPCTSPPFPYLAANGSLRVLDRAFSTTGLVVVAEYLDGPFRFMRCDHSLLGGKWLHSPEPGHPPVLSESIYTAFVLQEAVRLAEMPRSAAQERVLNIGLGVGIAVDSFKKHGLHTTVVEIDPAVYDFARKYFDLSEPDEVYLEDARQWVHQRAGSPKNMAYDIILHDCFSGGGVPEHIFTLEFWSELKSVMTPNGVLAVNFAGMIKSQAARGILVTLLSSFKSCRIFHDHFPAEDGLKPNAFLNMVFFCTHSDLPLTFREATTADFLNSYTREQVLGRLEDREIPRDFILGDVALNNTQWVIKDVKNPLGRWQEGSAMEHWGVMRGVLPHDVWNTY